MKIKKNIALSDSGFVFDPGNGNSYTTNPIGLEMIHLLKAGKSAQEIVDAIAADYDIDRHTLERDFSDFMNVLQKMQLVEKNGSEAD
jgi:hypothetical protein